MVYDATKSGLNKSLWVPTFALPTVDTLTSMLGPTSWMADLDIGEQFLNFPLDPAIQPACGIDVKPFLGSSASRNTWWLRWNCCMMGMKPSPYLAIKSTHLAEKTIFGGR